jgi:hypothetical protein
MADTVHKIKGFRLSRDWSIVWQKKVAATYLRGWYGMVLYLCTVPYHGIC